MAKKDVEKAVKEAHNTADKAIDEAQKGIREARIAVFKWLRNERTFNNAELTVIGLGFMMTVWALLLL